MPLSNPATLGPKRVFLRFSRLVICKQSSVLRRRGPWCAAHPGRECGPCVLCGSPSPYYSHEISIEHPSVGLASLAQLITQSHEPQLLV